MLSVKVRKRLSASPLRDSLFRANGPALADDGSLPAGTAVDGFQLDVEFDAPPGVTILFGASGSGKTMTLGSIAGILRPDSCVIAIDGKTLFDSALGVDLPLRKREVGYVFQSLSLFPHLSVL